MLFKLLQLTDDLSVRRQ